MLEDAILLLKFKHGHAQALERIYQKYKTELLSLATAMTQNKDMAEDVLQDVFVSFAKSAKSLNLRTSLRWYLTTAVANGVTAPPDKPFRTPNRSVLRFACSVA